MCPLRARNHWAEWRDMVVCWKLFSDECVQKLGLVPKNRLSRASHRCLMWRTTLHVLEVFLHLSGCLVELPVVQLHSCQRKIMLSSEPFRPDMILHQFLHYNTWPELRHKRLLFILIVQEEFNERWHAMPVCLIVSSTLVTSSLSDETISEEERPGHQHAEWSDTRTRRTYGCYVVTFQYLWLLTTYALLLLLKLLLNQCWLVNLWFHTRSSTTQVNKRFLMQDKQMRLKLFVKVQDKQTMLKLSMRTMHFPLYQKYLKMNGTYDPASLKKMRRRKTQVLWKKTSFHKIELQREELKDHVQEMEIMNATWDLE